MKKKDIRIGNIFTHLGEIIKVTDMSSNVVSSEDLIEVCAFNENSKSTYYKYFDIEHEAIEPLPINKKILDLYQWEEVRGRYQKRFLDLETYIEVALSLQPCGDKGGYDFYHNEHFLKHVTYVHELQNMLWGLNLNDDVNLEILGKNYK